MNESVNYRMRTINEAAAHFKSLDPNTALTKTAVRRLVNSGAIPSVKIGSKSLVALETLEAYLGGEQAPQPTPAPERGTIRRVEV